jgi:hypothetical protein
MPLDYRSLLNLPSPAEQRVMALLGLPSQQPAVPAATGMPPPTTEADQRFGDYYQANDQPPPAAAPDPFARTDDPLAPKIPLGYGGRNYLQATQQAILDRYAADASTKLAALDPADPDHLAKQAAILHSYPMGGQVLKDPRVAATVKAQAKAHGELQHFFASDPQSAYEYASLKQQGKSPEEAQASVRKGAALRHARLQYVERGGDPQELDQFVNPDTGIVDWPTALFHLRQSEGDVLQQPHVTWDKEASKLANEYQQLASDPLTGDDDVKAKEKWIADHKLNREDPQAWQAAHNGVMEERLAPVKKRIADLATDAEERRFVPNNRLREMAGLPPIPTKQDRQRRTRIDRAALAAQGAQSTAQPTASSPVRVESQAEYGALPSGAKYVDSQGRTATKR